MSSSGGRADVLFYVFDEASDPQPASVLPEGYALVRWRPSPGGLLPSGSPGARWLVWAAFHFLGIFSSGEYSVIEIRRGDEVVHRSGLFPRYFRFPFMDADDLQVGDTWTAPDARGRGLAVAALKAGVAAARARKARLWYLTSAENAASIAVAERAGLRYRGAGVRRARFGVRALGAYQLVPGSAADAAASQ